jgi:hypothetical protein
VGCRGEGVDWLPSVASGIELSIVGLLGEAWPELSNSTVCCTRVGQGCDFAGRAAWEGDAGVLLHRMVVSIQQQVAGGGCKGPVLYRLLQTCSLLQCHNQSGSVWPCARP